MNTFVYQALANSSLPWICCNCGMPNFASSLFDSSTNSSIDVNETSILSLMSSPPSSIGHPIDASSPKLPPNIRLINEDTHIRIVNINFQSLRCKKAEFSAFLEMTNPDIVMGSETWLRGQDYSSEYFPDTYKVYRADRTSASGKTTGYGGVLLAINNDLNSTEVKLPNKCEMVAAKFTIRKKLQVVVSTTYRPPNSDLEYATLNMDNLRELSIQNKSAIILAGGDFNLPDIQWSDMSIAGNQNLSAVNEMYLSTIQDLGLDQLVDFPTRYNPDNTLDLALTNRPSLVQRCVAIPGLSDHAAVLVTTKLRPAKIKPTKRKILLWKRADMIAIRNRIDELAHDFTSTYTPDTPIQELWEAFSSSMKLTIKDHIPSKWTSSTHTKPWANTIIKRLSRRQKKALKKYRQTKCPRDLNRLKRLQKAQRTECRKAYHTYLMGILDTDNGKKSNRLYSYVKSLKKDTCTVGPLRDSQGILQSDAAIQANLLNSQFGSVFTVEDTMNMPKLTNDPFPDMDTITIHENGVAKMLRNIKPHKATGPDEIPARLMKETADQLAPILTLLFQASYYQGIVPDSDQKVIGDITPEGYSLCYVPRIHVEMWRGWFSLS